MLTWLGRGLSALCLALVVVLVPGAASWATEVTPSPEASPVVTSEPSPVPASSATASPSPTAEPVVSPEPSPTTVPVADPATSVALDDGQFGVLASGLALLVFLASAHVVGGWRS